MRTVLWEGMGCCSVCLTTKTRSGRVRRNKLTNRGSEKHMCTANIESTQSQKPDDLGQQRNRLHRAPLEYDTQSFIVNHEGMRTTVYSDKNGDNHALFALK